MTNICLRPTVVAILLCFSSPLITAQTQQKTSSPSFATIPQMTQAQQENFPPKLLEDLKAIRDAALSDDYAYKQVSYLTENIGPRPSGSLQAKAGVDYVAGQLRKLGLEVQLEEVKVPHWVRGVETAELVEFPGQTPNTMQKIVVTALGGSTSTPPEGLTAEVVMVDNFEQLT